MTVKEWGDRVLVDLNWQGPKMFSLNRLPQTIPGYRGVYLITSRKMLYDYPKGRSSLLYIGSGWVGDRLEAHANRNKNLLDVLGEEGTLWFWYASASKGWHPCVEQVLFDEFESRHGGRPLLNQLRPSCRDDWSTVRVKHYNLAFPYDFCRSDFPF